VTSAALTPPTPFDRRVAFLVNPHVIAAGALATAVVFAVVMPPEVLVWAVAAAAIAGWSAAWSP
jgi:Na+-transporting NADH:ubiquinone oxidoreductase subunit NqrB